MNTWGCLAAVDFCSWSLMCSFRLNYGDIRESLWEKQIGAAALTGLLQTLSVCPPVLSFLCLSAFFGLLFPPTAPSFPLPLFPVSLDPLCWLNHLKCIHTCMSFMWNVSIYIWRQWMHVCVSNRLLLVMQLCMCRVCKCWQYAIDKEKQEKIIYLQ